MTAMREAQAGVDELFEMANLFPRTTGLAMTVWVSLRGNARHDVRVKVNMTHGDQMNIADTPVVGVRPTPNVIAWSAIEGSERTARRTTELVTRHSTGSGATTEKRFCCRFAADAAVSDPRFDHQLCFRRYGAAEFDAAR
jgi:hypothetical protein